jgi:hypothetical protein
VDVRVEKVIRLPGGRRLTGFVDVFNAFNANPSRTSAGRALTPEAGGHRPPRITRSVSGSIGRFPPAGEGLIS